MPDKPITAAEITDRLKRATMQDRWLADMVNREHELLVKTARYPNGQPMFASDGMMLDEDGNRSIFDDIDE